MFRKYVDAKQRMYRNSTHFLHFHVVIERVSGLCRTQRNTHLGGSVTSWPALTQRQTSYSFHNVPIAILLFWHAIT